MITLQIAVWATTLLDSVVYTLPLFYRIPTRAGFEDNTDKCCLVEVNLLKLHVPEHGTLASHAANMPLK